MKKNHMARPAKPTHERNINYNITIQPHYAQTWETLRAKFKSSGKAWEHLANYYTENETTALNNYPHAEQYLKQLETKLTNGQPITQNNIDSIRRLLTRKGENEYKQYLQTQNTNTTT